VHFLQTITPFVDAQPRDHRRGGRTANVAEVARRGRHGAAGDRAAGRCGGASGAELQDQLHLVHLCLSHPLHLLHPLLRTDAPYVGFEDRFRGSEDEIRSRLADYVPYFAGSSDVLDVGCGRGEFLDLLKQAGVSARDLTSTPDGGGLQGAWADATAATRLPGRTA
jgi:hypothetical protein